MDWSGAVLALALFGLSVVALVGYWQLALATIERRSYRFGIMYWSALASAIAVYFLASSVGHRLPWLLLAAPPFLSAVHFSYLQSNRKDPEVAPGVST